MFKLNPAPTFPLKVKISIPGQDAPGELQLVARHKGRKELTAWNDRAKGNEDAKFLGEVIVGWQAAGEDGQAVPYSEAALAQLLDDYPTSGFEIYDAYMKALTEGRAKN